ncbi:MAG: hypothetical protein ACJAVG_001212 [Rickettsiales bacterium]|jgi:hypothetical protein
MQNNNLVKIEAERLVAENGKKAINIAQRKVDNLKDQHSREGDFAFMVLSEVEKLTEN